MFPRGGKFSLNVALRLTSGAVLMTPKQLGPTTDILYFAARRTTSASSRPPASPISRNPEEMTTTPRAPIFPRSSTTSATAGAGTMTTPRSGRSGSSETLG